MDEYKLPNGDVDYVKMWETGAGATWCSEEINERDISCFLMTWKCCVMCSMILVASNVVCVCVLNALFSILFGQIAMELLVVKLLKVAKPSEAVMT